MSKYGRTRGLAHQSVYKQPTIATKPKPKLPKSTANSQNWNNQTKFPKKFNNCTMKNDANKMTKNTEAK